MKKKNSVLILMILIPMSAVCLTSNQQKLLLAVENQITFEEGITGTTHAPINASNDADLSGFASSGSGTLMDPFIIEGWDIVATTGNGIDISGTSEHFVIQNCAIEATTGIAVNINNVASETCIVRNNTITSSYYGILITNSDLSTVTDNYIEGNRYESIKLSYSGFSLVSNNTCLGNYNGIVLDHSTYCLVEENEIANNTFNGMQLSYSVFTIVRNNDFYNDGISLQGTSISDFFNYTIENNYIKGKPIGYFVEYSSTTLPTGYAQLIVVYCNNITITNQVISNSDIGLSLYYCYTVVVKNNQFNSNLQGIYVQNCYSITMTQNDLLNCTYTGVHCTEVDYFTVDDNTITGNFYGVKLWNCMFASISRVQTDCRVNGVRFDGCLSSNISLSLISNSEIGIHLDASSTSCIFSNIVENSMFYGVSLGVLCDYNHIYFNNFLNNSLSGTSQGYDDGTNNYWYSLFEFTIYGWTGNYWSDNPVGGPYMIDGSALNSDPHAVPSPFVIIIPEFKIELSFFIFLIPLVYTLVRFARFKRRRFKL